MRTLINENQQYIFGPRKSGLRKHPVESLLLIQGHCKVCVLWCHLSGLFKLGIKNEEDVKGRVFSNPFSNIRLEWTRKTTFLEDRRFGREDLNQGLPQYNTWVTINWSWTAFFWVITQRVVVIYYRLFGTTYRSHDQGSRDSWPLKMGPKVCPETSLRITIIRCVTTQKSAVLIYFAAEDWNHTWWWNSLPQVQFL